MTTPTVTTVVDAAAFLAAGPAGVTAATALSEGGGGGAVRTWCWTCSRCGKVALSWWTTRPSTCRCVGCR